MADIFMKEKSRKLRSDAFVYPWLPDKVEESCVVETNVFPRWGLCNMVRNGSCHDLYDCCDCESSNCGCSGCWCCRACSECRL